MKKTIKFIFITLFMWMVLSALSTANAASATIKADKTSATVGDSVKVTVTVNAAAWNLKVSGSTSGDIIGYNSDAENQTTTKTYTIDTGKAGTYKVTLSGDITDESKDVADQINTSVSITVQEKVVAKPDDNKDTAVDTNKKPVDTTDKNTSTTDKGSTTTNKDTTTPEKPKEKSNNAYLSTLGVTPKEYDFTGFKKGTTTYSVTVPSDVDSLKVLYKTADSNATVKVTGNSGFEVGSDNKITIKVTAEDGKTTKIYTIKVTKLAEEEEKPGNVIEDEEGVYLTSLELEGVEISPKFAKDTYSYTANLDDADVTEIKVNAKANKRDANIEISGNTELVDGENTINILITLDGSEEQTVYQVILTKTEKEPTGAASTENNNSENVGTVTDLMGNLKKYIVIAVAIVILVIVAIMVLIILLRRENKKMNEDEEQKEYNVYKNDANEFDNKKSEADNFIESLYRQRNGNLYNEEELNVEEKQTIEEINRETDKIFQDKVEGQLIEYTVEEVEKIRPRKRSKGKHSK